MKNLLALRNSMKLKKPDFVRQDAHKIKGLKYKWRRPKGRDSKMRRKLRGYKKSVNIGYRSPMKVRGLNREGYREILVNNINDLEKVKDGCIAIISGKVGIKNKIKVLNEAKKRDMNIGNVIDVDKFITSVQERFKTKKEIKKTREEKKERVKQETKKKPAEKQEGEEERKRREKEEKKKILEKKTKGSGI